MLSLMKLITLDEIALAVNAVLPASSTDAMRKSVQVAVLSTIRKMNLVSRDKVEELEKTLLQLREKIEALEESVAKPQQPEPDVVESFENEGGVVPPDPRDLFWESVKDTGVSQKTVADLFDQLVKKRKYGMTDHEIGTEIKRALLGWTSTNKAPKATPPKFNEISTNLMKLFIKEQVETARQSTGPSKPSARKKA